jgi:hypothetical protein
MNGIELIIRQVIKDCGESELNNLDTSLKKRILQEVGLRIKAKGNKKNSSVTYSVTVDFDLKDAPADVVKVISKINGKSYKATGLRENEVNSLSKIGVV